MQQPHVSIVTPVYNGAKYLEECIDSVRHQTYQNWDYTIVDNCSTDQTADIARQYAARDARIHVSLNTEFLPAMPNHNRALRQIAAHSKYCKVVFADDWLFPECLERMVGLAEAHPTVGLVSAYCLEGDHVICTGLPYASSVLDGRETCRRHLLDRLYLFGSANTVLYRADLVRHQDPFYNERNIHADTEVCFRLLRDCDFGFVHQIMTFTRLRPGSLNTISTDLGTYFSSMLHILETYGRDYLATEEWERLSHQYLCEYYRFLGKHAVLGRDEKFWAYHRNNLGQMKDGYSRSRLTRAALANLWRVAVSPKEVLGNALRRNNKWRSTGATS